MFVMNVACLALFGVLCLQTSAERPAAVWGGVGVVCMKFFQTHSSFFFLFSTLNFIALCSLVSLTLVFLLLT